MKNHRYYYKVFYDNKRYWMYCRVIAKNKEDAYTKANEIEEDKLKKHHNFHSFQIPKSYIERYE